MKLSPTVAAFFLAAVLGAQAGAQNTDNQASKAPPKGSPNGASPSALPPFRLDKVPLGNAIRMISARFLTSVTLTANAKAPISGDFSQMDLGRTLAEVARQAGLVVKPLGPDPGAGFALCKPDEASKLSEATEATYREMTPSAVKAALADAEKRREELLKQRAALEAKTPEPPPQP